ncbi:hypothetical protein [Micromonospora cathayae]|uniref:Uncharacterized protein n=1 Tax=Micromonospora cathayae TaxID=3028804 RepID=A0ABY7ZHQ5_9ACTN|nr:hypothetical protein [Micromonospora sp. HUAS 3]WDZ82410.1 hypothetical protein PVK37_18175 [Micromonospora sp. HUAS 3]
MPDQPAQPVSHPNVSAHASAGPHLAPPAVPLGTLPYGELAVAISAAGIPANPNELTVDQLKALATAGIIRLGLAEIHRRHEESRAANTSYCAKTRVDASADVSVEVTTIRRIWGSGRREQTAVNLGWRLGHTLTHRHPTP